MKVSSDRLRTDKNFTFAGSITGCHHHRSRIRCPQRRRGICCIAYFAAFRLCTRYLSPHFAFVADGTSSFVQNVHRNLVHFVNRLCVFSTLLQIIFVWVAARFKSATEIEVVTFQIFGRVGLLARAGWDNRNAGRLNVEKPIPSTRSLGARGFASVPIRFRRRVVELALTTVRRRSDVPWGANRALKECSRHVGSGAAGA